MFWFGVVVGGSVVGIFAAGCWIGSQVATAGLAITDHESAGPPIAWVREYVTRHGAPQVEEN